MAKQYKIINDIMKGLPRKRKPAQSLKPKAKADDITDDKNKDKKKEQSTPKDKQVTSDKSDVAKVKTK